MFEIAVVFPSPFKASKKKAAVLNKDSFLSILGRSYIDCALKSVEIRILQTLEDVSCVEHQPKKLDE